MAHARDRASLMFVLMQGTACEFLRNKAEPCLCPSGCQRQFQAMSNLSQTLFVSKGHLARLCLRKVSARTLSPGERLKYLDIVHLGRGGSWKGLAALKESFSSTLHLKDTITHNSICSTPSFDEPQKEQLLPLQQLPVAYRQKLITFPHRLIPGELELLQIALVFLASLVQGIGTALLWGESADGVRRTRGVMWRVSKSALWRPGANFSSSWGRPERASKRWTGWDASCCMSPAVPAICQFCDAISWEKPEMQLWITAVVVKHI